MPARPSPIPGLPHLPLAPPLHAPAAPENIIHATGSHPQEPIPPHPVGTAAPPQPQAPSSPPATAGEENRMRSHTFAKRGRRPTAHHSRTQATAVLPQTIATARLNVPDQTITLHPEIATARHIDRIAPHDHSTARTAASSAPAPIESPRVSISERAPAPRFEPVPPEAYDIHDHPLAIRVPMDVFRFFPIIITLSAIFASLSGLLAGLIANHIFGGDTTPAIFVGVYLTLFLLNLLTHYHSSKGQLFFHCQHRFLRLLIANALLLSPHFIAYTLLLGLVEK